MVRSRKMDATLKQRWKNLEGIRPLNLRRLVALNDWIFHQRGNAFARVLEERVEDYRRKGKALKLMSKMEARLAVLRPEDVMRQFGVSRRAAYDYIRSLRAIHSWIRD